jgi:hypothetical protein
MSNTFENSPPSSPTTRRERRAAEGYIRHDDPNYVAEPIFLTRRDALKAEGHVRHSKNDVFSLEDHRVEKFPFSDEELLKVSHARRFLALNAATQRGNVLNHENYPEYPILSLVNNGGLLLSETIDEDALRNSMKDPTYKARLAPVDITDQLEVQADVIALYQQDVESGNWETITYLDRQWLDMMNEDVETEKKPKSVFKKIGEYFMGQFVAPPVAPPQSEFHSELRMAAFRQHWMNGEVAYRLSRESPDMEAKFAA